MKIERTKNATRNIKFGIILKAYQIIIPFVMRTAMIYLLGIEYLGLNSLFTSVLQVLNLAELGIGSAMIYSMYKPIAEDDTITICALMHLYKIYYRIIGIVICIIGIILLPFIPSLISGSIPADMNVYILYLLNLSATVLSYWLFAYKNSILQAHQRTDITSKVMLVTETIKYILQILALILLHNYYYFVIVLLIIQIITNISTAIISDKMYPNYKAKGKLPRKEIKNINSRIKDLFTAKIGMVIVNSADTIVISAFLGLSTLAVYQNYFYLLTAVIGVMTVIFMSCLAGIGNSIVTETKEKNFNDLKKFTFIISWIAGVCTVCFLCLFQPFMKVWVGEKYLLSFSVVICLCVYFFVYEINQLLNIFKDAAGIWHEDRFRPLVTAGVNLALNLILVQFIGIYGIILATVISTTLVGLPWLLHNLFTVLFDRKYLHQYLKKLFYYIIIVTISCLVTLYICNLFLLPDILNIGVRFIFCIIVPNVIYMIAYHNTCEFKETIQLINKITHNKISYLNRFNIK